MYRNVRTIKDKQFPLCEHSELFISHLALLVASHTLYLILVCGKRQKWLQEYRNANIILVDVLVFQMRIEKVVHGRQAITEE
jgi:hypothetical protein